MVEKLSESKDRSETIGVTRFFYLCLKRKRGQVFLEKLEIY